MLNDDVMLKIKNAEHPSVLFVPDAARAVVEETLEKIFETDPDFEVSKLVITDDCIDFRYAVSDHVSELNRGIIVEWIENTMKPQVEALFRQGVI